LLIGASEARLLREAGWSSHRRFCCLWSFKVRCVFLAAFGCLDRIDYELELDKTKCVEGGLRLGMRLAKLVDERGQLNREFDVRNWGRIYGKYDGYFALFSCHITSVSGLSGNK
jgi:hypothetical protein